MISEGAQKIRFIPKLAETQVVTSIPGVEPDLKIIAPVLRTLSRGLKVEIEYISTSSGVSTRLIAPHSLIAAGNFKYVRAFDHKTAEFRAFKLNRIVNARPTSWKIGKEMNKDSDQEWNKKVILKLTANRNLKHKESIEFDFGLINGYKEVKIRKALIPFFLMDWNIAPQEHEHLPATLFPLEVKKIIQ
ncbi:YafY family protein [Thiomicrorhabdus sp. Kp2]|uniref:helix-turn-helix transcriptional regulator n=1 Tax=Thiomicrorhabdus sp. Kp2 TaxID=1123518 RepID=UPI0003FC2279|nr:WYL domain-containing protein [Thiomicrorhabdus sp. Kp2]